MEDRLVCLWRKGVVMVAVQDRNYNPCVHLCVCVLEHLLLVGFVFPPLYDPPLLWVLDS